MNHPRPTNPALQQGSSVMKILVAVAVVAVLIAIVITLMKSSKAKADLLEATKKMQALGTALQGYAADSGGLIPMEDAPGRDDWRSAALPDSAEVWYNVLPKRLGAPPVSELESGPEAFYDKNYPLFIPGAPYPKSDKKLSKPYFAVAMNSRLHRKLDDDTKPRVPLASILNPGQTVIFLERGMKDDEKVSKTQGAFDGSAKATAKDFAARHNQKGLILFADGHTEVHSYSDLVDKAGNIPIPQERIIWTPDPSANPN